MPELATEVIRTFRQILYRDTFYVICGALIAAYVGIFIFEQSPSQFISIDGFWLFAFVGLSLSIGFVNQELWSQIGVITTSTYRTKYPWLCKAMYYRHTHIRWRNRDPSKPKRIDEAWEKERWSRIIDLKQIGSSLASCNLTLTAISSWAHWQHRAPWSLIVLHMFGFFAFWSVCWVKTMQQAEAEFEVSCE